MERCHNPPGAPIRRGPDYSTYLTLNDILKKLLMHIKFTWGIFLPLEVLKLRELRATNDFYNMEMPLYNLVWNPNNEWDQLEPNIVHLVVDLVKPLPPLPPLYTQTLQPPETVDQVWWIFDWAVTKIKKLDCAAFMLPILSSILRINPSRMDGCVCVYLLNRSKTSLFHGFHFEPWLSHETRLFWQCFSDFHFTAVPFACWLMHSDFIYCSFIFNGVDTPRETRNFAKTQ